MKKMANTNFILRISIFIIVMQGMLSSCSYKSESKRNICGIWSIDVDKSHVDRSMELNFGGNVIYIDMKEIMLPRNRHPILGEEDQTTEEKQKKVQELNVLSKKESIGEWDVIYSTSDSVIFKAPNHPLNGRYEVHIFQEDLHEYMTLSNDSTYLFCYRSGYVR